MRPPALLAIALLSLSAAPVRAADYVVRPDGSGDFPTIQAAVDAAVDDDVIQLSEGVFAGPGNRDVQVVDKTLVIRSLNGNPAQCTIDCQSAGRGFSFEGFQRHSRVEGITITGGREEVGGAILDRAGIYVVNCIFRGNLADQVAGAAVSTSGIFQGCRFEDNTALECCGAIGGGSGGSTCCLTLRDCVFLRNSARFGAAVDLESLSPTRAAVIQRCTFAENVATGPGGIVSIQGGSAVIEACTFAENSTGGRGALDLDWLTPVISNTIIAFTIGGPAVSCDSSAPTLICCDLYGNTGGDWVGCLAGQAGQEGNLSADPLFCDPSIHDYGLNIDSPCGPEHNPGCGLIGAWPEECGTVPIVQTTWGGLKARFR